MADATPPKVINPKTWEMALAVTGIFANANADVQRYASLSRVFLLVSLPCLAWRLGDCGLETRTYNEVRHDREVFQSPAGCHAFRVDMDRYLGSRVDGEQLSELENSAAAPRVEPLPELRVPSPEGENK